MRILVDSHCDTIERAFEENKPIDDTNFSFNLKSAKQIGMPVIQMMASFIHPKYEKSFERAKGIINYFYEQQKHFQEELMVIKTREDIDKCISENKIGAVLTIENGRAIEKNLSNVDYLYQQGIKIMSINWNEDNLLGCGALTKRDEGLTKFGSQYVKKLNEKNIIVDISHSSTKTFWDTMKTSEGIVVATHSNCKALCEHPRNLDDTQIKEIAKQDGMIGICYCAPFLSETGVAKAKDVAIHIAHIANLVGIDYVGLRRRF